MSKNNKFKILILLILNISFLNAGAVKSTANNGSAPTKSLDIVSSGAVGIQNESKRALIGEDPLATQNYNNIDREFDFSTYQKITLKKTILETLASSNTLKAANEKLIQSKIAYSEASNGYLPTVNFTFDTKVDQRYAILESETGKRDTKIIHDQRYKFTIDQPLYSGGTTKLKIKNLETKYQEAKNKYHIVLNQTIQKAIKAYFTLLFDIEKVEITIQNMKKLKEILDISQVKYDSGAISVGDLAAIKAGVANAETKLNGTKSRLADSIDYYLYLLNNKFDKTKPFEKNFTINVGTFEELKDKIIQNNLSLINFRLNIQATKYKLKSFKYNMKPKIDLQMKMVHILNQEDYSDDEQTYSAKVSFRYNIYNKGADLNSIIKVHSSIEELDYRYQEEIKKISWDTSKLYNSINSLSKSLESTQTEIKASIEMVDVYWEGFQLGEQDLQILLQGQRQLNTAKTTLLKLKKDYLTNMFKVLNQTNELASFFNINYKDPYFIDFTEVEDQKYIVDMNTSINTQIAELNTTKGTYLELIQEYTFDNIVSFKDLFLEEDDDEDKYSIVISDFNNNYEAYSYLKLNRLMTNSFNFDYFKENGILQENTLDKKVTVSTKIAHGIYNNKELAQEEINDNFDINEKNFKIYKVSEIKDMYSSYVDSLSTSIKPYIIKPIEKKTFKTNLDFKKSFLEANKEYFTINIVSLSNMHKAEQLLLNNNILNESFVFKYGRNGKWIKVVYGIFETYSQALETLNQKQKLINKYHPIIEKISHKQELYYKYEKYNIPKIIKTKVILAKKKEIKFEKNVILNKNKSISKVLLPKDTNKKTDRKSINNIKESNTSVIEKRKKSNIKANTLNKHSFKTKFLNANPKIYYTTNMALFTNKSSALKFLESNNIKENSIIIEFSKNKKDYYKIMYGLYKSKDEARESINNLPKSLANNKPTIEGVRRKQILYKTGNVELSKKAYNKYLENNTSENILNTNVKSLKNKEIKDKKKLKPVVKNEIKTNKDNSDFINKFNNANEDKYTIRIAYVTPKRLNIFIDKFVLDNNFIVHKIFNNYRILYGIYDSQIDAKKAISNLHPKRVSKAKIIKIKSIR